MENPFKFGTIVDGDFFTDRVKETQQLLGVLNSRNHVVIISPRRYGKSSLVARTLAQLQRRSLTVNMQSVTSTGDLAATLLRRVFKLFPFEKVKHLVSHFRFVPTLSVNPTTNGVDVAFHPSVDSEVVLEDAFELLERLGERQRLVVVLDEFQEILSIDKTLDRKLRAIMQAQNHINYVLLGSQESMMAGIFERKRSPFYHFGQLMRIGRIGHDDFMEFLAVRLGVFDSVDAHDVSQRILAFTDGHPYYTQQLAFQVWNTLALAPQSEDVVATAIADVVQLHDYDYERLWATVNKTDKNTLLRLAAARSVSTQPSSTVQSSLKRLERQGMLVKNGQYRIEDPFYARWLSQQ